MAKQGTTNSGLRESLIVDSGNIFIYFKAFAIFIPTKCRSKAINGIAMIILMVLFFSERCVVLQGRKQFRWAGWNCGYQKDGQTLFKALCQKESFQKLVTTTTPQSPTNSEQIKSPRLDTQCAVFGVSLSGDDWLSRHSNVDSASTCHNDCLNTRGCNVWTWRSDSKLCYLKNKDAAVVKDVLAVSGTTSTKQGCNRDILQSSSISQPTKVEYCSCKTVSHDVVSGYIDPRALPEADDLSNLGRFIRHNACPNGQVLTCSDVPSHVSSNQDFAPKTSNITQCLVHDVRLTVGGHVGVIPHVDSAETCHNYCLIHKECAYWTWRGETLDRKCFMLPHEGRLVRRQGSSSGTVTRDQGCDHKIVSPEPEAAQYREDSEIECECERDSNTNDIDYVGLGLIDPRSVPEEADDSNTTPSPSGRIVNINKDDGEINCLKKCSVHCPNGWKPVCPSTFEEPKHHNNVVASNNNFNDGPKLFTGTLGQFPIGEEYARPRNIPKRELGTEEKKSDHSAVSFPQAEVISY